MTPLFLALELNSEPVKYVIVALTAPLWIPFAKALWKTLNDSLREEGGLLGEAPTPEALAAMDKKQGRFEAMDSKPHGPETITQLGAAPTSTARSTGTSMGKGRGFQ